MANTRRKTSERSLIASLRAKVGRADTQGGSARSGRAGNVIVGIGDDCAVLNVPNGHQIVVTTDFSLENVHFRRDWQSPESIGHRCLARGLSDLAAMGARPLAAFLSLALPKDLTRTHEKEKSWRERFLDGLLALALEHQVPLAGGDTAQSPSTYSRGGESGRDDCGLALADIVLAGSVPRGRALLRSGAQPGDGIYVTGHLGGAAAELTQIAESARGLRARKARSPGWREADINLHPHLFPRPRIDVGAWLLKNRRATSAIDISDGLSTDLNHLCEESGTAAIIDAALLPIHPLAVRATRGDRENATKLALDGGEDYELLFTAVPQMQIPRRVAGVSITRIGAMRRPSPRKPRMMLMQQESRGLQEYPLFAEGWEHYKR
jgi:thiamine-monophosphate kinase